MPIDFNKTTTPTEDDDTNKRQNEKKVEVEEKAHDHEPRRSGPQQEWEYDGWYPDPRPWAATTPWRTGYRNGGDAGGSGLPDEDWGAPTTYGSTSPIDRAAEVGV